MFAGMLAFDVLDRLTGDWSVTNTDWFQGFYAAVIQVLLQGSLHMNRLTKCFMGAAQRMARAFVLHHHTQEMVASISALIMFSFCLFDVEDNNPGKNH